MDVWGDLADQELIDRFQRGDAAGFEALYSRYFPWARVVARRFCGEDEMAEDAAQSVFLILLEKLPTLRLTAKLTTYLYPIVRRVALRSRQARDRLTVLGESMPPPALAFEPAEPFVGSPLHLAIQALPPAQAEVVILRFVDDFSLLDIASALSIPLGTVKSRLHHAMGRLRLDPNTRDYFLEQRGQNFGVG